MNALPWGLDVSVNAELFPSQRVVIKQICRDPVTFDQVVREHGRLVFQAWLKLEHRPRSYHWFPAGTAQPGDWNAKTVLDSIIASTENFGRIRPKAISWLEKNRTELSQNELSHLMGRNKLVNLALRFVDPICEASPFWTGSTADQIEQLNCSYASLKPLIDFFHDE